MNVSIKSQLGLFAALLLAGCMVGPDYVKPTVPTEDQFIDPQQPDVVTTEQAVEWWRSFDDQYLLGLIERSVVQNKDLDIALAALRIARANRGEVFLDLFPTITTSGGYQQTQISGNVAPNQSYNLRRTDLYDAGFDAFWEIDIFGRVRREVEAADSEEEATEADVRDVMRTLIAEVARNYVELRGAQDELRVLHENALTQEDSVQLTQKMYDAGRNTELDTSRARAQWKSTLATIPPVELKAQAAMFRLAVLTGEQPQALRSELQKPAPRPKYVGPITIGDPEALLRRRPDVVAAERRLESAVAGIGIAMGDLFPRITFNGSIGVTANSPSNWKHNADRYNFGPQFTWAAFNLGRVREQIRAANAQADAQLAQYEQTVLHALEDVEFALAQLQAERASNAALRDATIDSKKAADLARLQYDNGLIDFLAVLDAQRVALLAEERYALSQTAAVTAIIALYKALGGGWEGYEIREGSQAAVNPAGVPAK